jgi:hypothetical protein
MVEIGESSVIGLDAAIDLLGGYDTDFLNQSGMTTLIGNMTIGKGSCRIDSISLQ